MVTAAGLNAAALLARYDSVRAQTERLCAPLCTEDYVPQSMPDCSPAKWHLGHTAWFFETFVLAARPGYQQLHPSYKVLFNSYYHSVGDRHARPERGLLTRPTVEEVYAYRAAVDRRVREVLADGVDPTLAAVIELGLHHEQQHQELLLTDLLHLFSRSPLRPAYAQAGAATSQQAAPLTFHELGEGIYPIGHGGPGFAFDNEGPRHQVLLQAYQLGSRLITAGEYLDFMADDGYGRSALWLSEGWDAVQREGWRAPLYWEQLDGAWWHLTLHGMQPVRAEQPVCHISYYEADAYARWAAARLPTEFEWEAACASSKPDGSFLEGGLLHPSAATAHPGAAPGQWFGEVWQWTQSAYSPYPRYRPAAGALGEYNGKFMCGQLVLRGASCVTPRSHARSTYRNFFPPAARWQFSGLRLAKDLPCRP